MIDPWWVLHLKSEWLVWDADVPRTIYGNRQRGLLGAQTNQSYATSEKGDVEDVPFTYLSTHGWLISSTDSIIKAKVTCSVCSTNHILLRNDAHQLKICESTCLFCCIISVNRYILYIWSGIVNCAVEMELWYVYQRLVLCAFSTGNEHHSTLYILSQYARDMTVWQLQLPPVAEQSETGCYVIHAITYIFLFMHYLWCTLKLHLLPLHSIYAVKYIYIYFVKSPPNLTKSDPICLLLY
jgi:hypothetical protein